MNRKLLDTLYENKQIAEAEVKRLKDVDCFPDDGFSFEVHKSQLESARKMTVIFNSLIDIYIGE